MRILLDESLPKPLAREFVGYPISTVVGNGWSGKKNGELLRLAQEDFDIFITADQNLQYQQNLRGYKIAVVVLASKTNRLANLKPLVPKLLKLIHHLKIGEVTRIS